MQRLSSGNDELPRAFPNPFDEIGPHPVAKQAAERLQSELLSGLFAQELSSAGKMFGVLVARDAEGALFVLRAFSGMLDGRWDAPGFVPPLFDRTERERIEVPGEAAVSGLFARAEAHRTGPALVARRAARDAMAERHAAESKALQSTHAANRQHRARLRETTSDPAALHDLDQQSRGDKAERRRLDARHEDEVRQLTAELAPLERRRGALERLRGFVSRRLMRRLHDTYVVRNARGEQRGMRDLFVSREPPSGAGDCAAPKLLGAAYARGLMPIALAEFWWGPPPATGGRLEGNFYPACRAKCGPLLPFMLEGLDVTEAASFRPPAAPAELRILFEDASLVLVAKPEGLLSVPGKGAALEDSVLTRLRKRHPSATGPLLVHRLDLDTSGVLVAALDAATHAHLQRQFAQREVEKRYVAWLDGNVVGDSGTIDLALRVDLDDRPRQIHDPVHGLDAVTEWRVLERREGRTRVALFPRTGRTHQLRVHAAHPRGLAAPIVGDRLYGRGGERLQLHAESIAFEHPATGARLVIEWPAPF